MQFCGRPTRVQGCDADAPLDLAHLCEAEKRSRPTGIANSFGAGHAVGRPVSTAVSEVGLPGFAVFTGFGTAASSYTAGQQTAPTGSG